MLPEAEPVTDCPEAIHISARIWSASIRMNREISGANICRMPAHKRAASSTSTELNMRKTLLLFGLCGLLAGVPGVAAVSAPLLSDPIPGQIELNRSRGKARG